MKYLFLFPLFLYSQIIPLFHPPKDWECVLPENISSYVQVGFLGKGASFFRPSVNLAIEEIDVGLKEYIKAVKEIHLSEPNTTWRDLGKFKTRSGEGRLAEITTQSPAGPVKILQMILVQDKIAYILTGASLKDEFLQFQKTFTQCFQSLSLTSDLLSPLGSDKKKQFEDFLSTLDTSSESNDAKWEKLQKKVLQDTEMGAYWQFLVLKEGREKIFK